MGITSYTVGMTQVLDTYREVKELVSSGFVEEQAQAVVSLQARILNENVASKQDIALVQRDIEKTRADIEALRLATQKDIEIIHKDIESFRAETRKDIEIIHKDIESLRAETSKDIESLRLEIKKDMLLLSSQLTVRVGAMLVAAVGILGSLQTFAG